MTGTRAQDRRGGSLGCAMGIGPVSWNVLLGVGACSHLSGTCRTGPAASSRSPSDGAGPHGCHKDLPQGPRDLMAQGPLQKALCDLIAKADH